jgi:hypothetical protein
MLCYLRAQGIFGRTIRDSDWIEPVMQLVFNCDRLAKIRQRRRRGDTHKVKEETPQF